VLFALRSTTAAAMRVQWQRKCADLGVKPKAGRSAFFPGSELNGLGCRFTSVGDPPVTYQTFFILSTTAVLIACRASARQHDHVTNCKASQRCTR
jgi:hypothetical protein